MLVIYSKNNCPECVKASTFLDSKGVPYKVVKVDEVPSAREFLISKGHRAVPVVYDDFGVEPTLVGAGFKAVANLTDAQLEIFKK